MTGDPNVVSYAGAQLVNPDGFKIGTMCVIDSKPGSLNDEQKRSLKAIANQVVMNLELRKSLIDLRLKNEHANRMQVQLVNANEELSQFAYRTSHDLKSPLITVKGLARAITEDLKNKDYTEAEKNSIEIEQHVSKLEILVTDILHLAKADLLEMGNEKIDLSEIVADLKTSLSKVYIDNDVTIELSSKSFNGPYCIEDKG